MAGRWRTLRVNLTQRCENRLNTTIDLSRIIFFIKFSNKGGKKKVKGCVEYVARIYLCILLEQREPGLTGKLVVEQQTGDVFEEKYFHVTNG